MILSALAEEIVAIKASDDFREAMATIGGDVMADMTPAQFQAYVSEQLRQNVAFAKAAGIQPK